MSARADDYRKPLSCDGCGDDILEGKEETLAMMTPLGQTSVHVHRDKACALAAKDRIKRVVGERPGDKFKYVMLGPAKGEGPVVPSLPGMEEQQ
jgi:hypothetical protein